MKKIADYDASQADADDGTFWMSFEDFAEHFSTVYLLRRFKDASEQGGWHRYGYPIYGWHCSSCFTLEFNNAMPLLQLYTAW